MVSQDKMWFIVVTLLWIMCTAVPARAETHGYKEGWFLTFEDNFEGAELDLENGNTLQNGSAKMDNGLIRRPFSMAVVNLLFK